MKLNDYKKPEGQIIVEAIKERLEKEAGRIFEEEKKRMVDELISRLESERTKIIAGTVINLSKYFQIEQNREHIVLSINTADLVERK